MSITRRIFLAQQRAGRRRDGRRSKFSYPRGLWRGSGWGRTKRLVVIFQRGAADGLNIVVPHGESQYYAMRPSINIPRKSVIDLDGFFGLHPSLVSVSAALATTASGDCACGRIARLRRAPTSMRRISWRPARRA